MINITSFKIIGIQIRTTNKNEQASKDLGKLWEQFYTQDISSQIPNKECNEIYSIYTDYESDYKGKYTSIIGLKVNSLDQIPEGLVGREFKGGKYQKFVAKGQMPHAVVNMWQEIWQKDKKLNRKYTVDFEVYGQESNNIENPEVAIYIATE